MTVFDAFDNVLGSVGSAFASNLALSGDPGSSANEFIELAFAGIRRLTISADPAGSSFVLDDLAYRSAAAVPEPASALLVAAGIAGLALRRRRQEAR